MSTPIPEAVNRAKVNNAGIEMSAPIPEPVDRSGRKEINVDTDMSMPLTKGAALHKITKADWSGLNYRQVHDTGALSYEYNISTSEAPYLTPSQKRVEYRNLFGCEPICMYGFDDFLLEVHISFTNTVYIYYINAENIVYGGQLDYNADPSKLNTTMRSIVKFNVYDTPTDPVSGNYVRKLLIFPDKKSINFKINAHFIPENMSAGISQVPNIKHAAVHLSRLFGVDDDRIYASSFNDYANWSLDTIDDHNASNAWVSPAQSNTKADGNFTAITMFANHVICFKKDYMHELYNNKNPFRIQDIFAEGTIDHRSIQDVNGRLIFVSSNGVKAYTGGNPRDIGYNLGVNKFTKAVAGTDGRKYYLYCSTEKKEHNLFIYDSAVDQWAEESIDFEVRGFAKTTTGMYMLAFIYVNELNPNSRIYKLDTGDYSHNWAFETDFYMGQSIDITHIQKIQFYAELANGSKLQAYLLYDDEVFNASTSHKIYDHTNTTGATKKVTVRVVPRQTANYGFKLRVNGYGFARLYHLEAFIRQGGELFV